MLERRMYRAKCGRLTRLRKTAAQTVKHVPGPFTIKTSQTGSAFDAARTACLTQATSDTSTEGGVVQRD